jgi:hypothetical protein
MLDVYGWLGASCLIDRLNPGTHKRATRDHVTFLSRLAVFFPCLSLTLVHLPSVTKNMRTVIIPPKGAMLVLSYMVTNNQKAANEPEIAFRSPGQSGVHFCLVVKDARTAVARNPKL